MLLKWKPCGCVCSCMYLPDDNLFYLHYVNETQIMSKSHLWRVMDMWGTHTRTHICTLTRTQFLSGGRGRLQVKLLCPRHEMRAEEQCPPHRSLMLVLQDLVCRPAIVTWPSAAQSHDPLQPSHMTLCNPVTWPSATQSHDPLQWLLLFNALSSSFVPLLLFSLTFGF